MEGRARARIRCERGNGCILATVRFSHPSTLTQFFESSDSPLPRRYLGRAIGSLFYVFPVIPSHRRTLSGKDIAVSEYLIGVMWLIDLLEHEFGGCVQKDLAVYVSLWWPAKKKRQKKKKVNQKTPKPTALSRTLRDLLRVDFVRSGKLPSDRRGNSLRLTAKGSRFLSRFQMKRIGALKRQGVPDDLISEIEAIGHRIADVMWSARVERIRQAAARRLAARKPDTRRRR